MSTVVAALHAASRDALAVAEQRLSAVVESARPASLTAIGEELLAVAGLLSREPGLRRNIGDSSSDAAARERLARGLFAGKVREQTLSLLVAAVTARWSSPRELVLGVEHIGRSALLARAEKEGRLDAVEDELFRLGRIVAGQPELDLALSDPAGSPDGKRALVERLLTGKAEPVTVSLAAQLVASVRGRDVADGLAELADLAAKRRERSVAHVRSAVALTDAQADRLATLLERVYSRPIALHIEVDPHLGGGLSIKVGDEIIDGSVLGRLAALRRELA
jgi:F-type H+-transporting ATPase subunit delta